MVIGGFECEDFFKYSRKEESVCQLKWIREKIKNKKRMYFGRLVAENKCSISDNAGNMYCGQV